MTSPLRAAALVGTSGALTGLGHGFVAYAVSALLKPLAEDLALGRGGVSLAVGMGRVVSGACAPVAGRSADRWGSRPVVIAGLAVTGAGLAAMALVQGQVTLILVWSGLICAGVSLAFTVALDRMVVGLVPASRGRALAARFAVAGVVTAAQVPIVATMVESWGWRTTCVAWGLLMLALIAVPLLVFPAEASRPAARHAEQRDLRRTILRSRAFWCLGATMAVQGGTSTAMALHLIPLLTDGGVATATAAALVGGVVLAAVPLRLWAGWLADRATTGRLTRLLGGLMVLQAGAMIAQAVAPGPVPLGLMMLALAVGGAVPTLFVLVLTGRLFDGRIFGTVQGNLMLVQVPATLAAPVVAGWSHDLTRSYAPALGAFAVALALAALPLLLGAVAAPPIPEGQP